MQGSERLLERKFEVKQGVTLNGNVIYARHMVENPYRWDYELSSFQNYLMDKIILVESGWDPEAKNPYSTASGYCQFLDKTKRYVQKKWEMEIDFEDPEQQLYACRRLLDEEGTRHWLASKDKWVKYVQ